jgi:hypothetical protein
MRKDQAGSDERDFKVRFIKIPRATEGLYISG